MIWVGKANYALFRTEVKAPPGLGDASTRATAYVTAQVSGNRQKLLGASPK